MRCTWIAIGVMALSIGAARVADDPTALVGAGDGLQRALGRRGKL